MAEQKPTEPTVWCIVTDGSTGIDKHFVKASYAHINTNEDLYFYGRPEYDEANNKYNTPTVGHTSELVTDTKQAVTQEFVPKEIVAGFAKSAWFSFFETEPNPKFERPHQSARNVWKQKDAAYPNRSVDADV